MARRRSRTLTQGPSAVPPGQVKIPLNPIEEWIATHVDEWVTRLFKELDRHVLPPGTEVRGRRRIDILIDELRKRGK